MVVEMSAVAARPTADGRQAAG